MRNDHHVMKRLCFRQYLGSLVLKIAYPYRYLGLWVTAVQSLGFEAKVDLLLPARLFPYVQQLDLPMSATCA